MRVGDGGRSLPRVQAGPVWNYQEADEQAHQFLIAVAGNRDIYQYLEDPIEHARLNGLLLLFNDEVNEAFETYLARMPTVRAQAWREFIAGGVSAEAFGPLTLQEQVDERRLESNLRAARRASVVTFFALTTPLVGLIFAGIWLWNVLSAEESNDVGRIRFAAITEPNQQSTTLSEAPMVEPRLTTSLESTVAVVVGTDDLALRIVRVTPEEIRYRAGDVAATLFQFQDEPQVVFVGPQGFAEVSCLRAAVVTETLRPLDVVTTGCVDPIGRSTTIACVGPTAIMMQLDVPAASVELPEGGSGVANAVRVQLIGQDERFATLSLRGSIEVGAGTEVVVPQIVAAPGNTLTFDLGGDHIGSCAVNGGA